MSSLEQQTQDKSLFENETWFKDKSLQLFAGHLATRGYPRYPSQLERLTTISELPVTASGKMVLPDGSWSTDKELPTVEEYAELQTLGLDFDQYDRPLHPWLKDMLNDPNVGVVTGKGAYWDWGPNYTADPVIIRRDLSEPYVLLITRRDTGALALPGGFVDADETPFDAAVREAQEETCLDLGIYNPTVREIYSGPVADLRATANAWPHTTAYAFELPDEITKQMSTHPYEAGSDATLAGWFPAQRVPDYLFGSHKILVEMALNKESNNE